MGFDLTASLPVENATFLDYFRHELLARRGGLLNLYMSYTGRNPCPASGELVNFRLAETDRVYFSRDSPDKQKALFFWSHGVGGRILKTDLPGTIVNSLQVSEWRRTVGNPCFKKRRTGGIGPYRTYTRPERRG